LRNPLVHKELGECLKEYSRVLSLVIKDFKSPDLEGLNRMMKSGQKLSKDQLQAYHALKLEKAISSI
jgi:hypothetical protein